MSADPVSDANIQQVVPFFPVTDMERSLRFYVDGLGCRMTNKWIDEGKLRWCWLELGPTALMLQEYTEEARREKVGDQRLGLGLAINFICKDAIALWRELISRGVAAQRPFVGNNMWVTQVTDPDGYELFFESDTDAPEESVFEEP